MSITKTPLEMKSGVGADAGTSGVVLVVVGWVNIWW